MTEAHDYGERKHETCRFGSLTPGFRIAAEGSSEQAPVVLPLCGWQVPAEAPPALKRQWGGLVDYERDCAVCTAYRTVEATPATHTPGTNTK